MCGLVSVASLPEPLDPEIAGRIRAMNGALAHRGPDGDGFWQDGHAALGHRRLAIIDRSGGDQPMSNEDGTVWIVFNGEVYNHHALRQHLESRGHVFRTHSDTETIIHAWEEWGTASVERLEGMFAYVIYDQRSRQLFAARDRLGKKPLFYARLGGALHIASEIKAMQHSPAWDGTTDLEALEGYLSLGYLLAPSTVYRHVKKLEPGHWLLYRNGQLETRSYWDVTEFDVDQRPEAEVLAELDDLLDSVVHERLESEVPLGAFLSGGIDSGLMVAYMARHLDGHPITTSVGFDDREHNELDAAAVTARAFDTEHHAHLLVPDLGSVMNRIVGAFDEPFADSSAIPTYYVSQAAREHVTVALSGDGGDESFAGYDFRYVPHALEQRARRLVPGGPGRAVVGAVARRYPRSTRLPRALRWRTILENLASDPADAYYHDLCFLKPGPTRRLLGTGTDGDIRQSPVYEAVTAPYRRCPSNSDVQKAQYADLKVYLPNDVLVKVDRMSMLHSLEVRCPLLDRRVVEFAFRLPTSTKMAGLRGKHLLRQLARRRLPAELATLPKKGFTVPIGRWIAGPYAGAWREDVLGSRSIVHGLLDVDHLSSLFDAHVEGRADHGYALWSTWMLARWHEAQATR
jgi:asparagine synthase (glutamine-hydrolysing)